MLKLNDLKNEAKKQKYDSSKVAIDIDNFLYDFSYGKVIKNKNLVVKLKTFVIDNRRHLEDVIGYKIYDEFINGIENLTEVKEIDIMYADLISVSKEYIPSSARSIMITIYDLSKISYKTIMIVSLAILLGIIIGFITFILT